MEQRILSYKNSGVSYYRFGTGPNPVICFHGYGEDGKLYGFLEKYAGTDYTFFCIDLPFHGKTKWNEGLLFTHKDLLQIIFEITEQNNFSGKARNLSEKPQTSNLKPQILCPWL